VIIVVARGREGGRAIKGWRAWSRLLEVIGRGCEGLGSGVGKKHARGVAQGDQRGRCEGSDACRSRNALCARTARPRSCSGPAATCAPAIAAPPS
jgi:hypothetical protein